MPWPKGVPRIGHVNKDGTQHRRRVSHFTADAVITGPLKVLPNDKGGHVYSKPMERFCYRCRMYGQGKVVMTDLPESIGDGNE